MDSKPTRKKLRNLHAKAGRSQTVANAWISRLNLMRGIMLAFVVCLKICMTKAVDEMDNDNFNHAILPEFIREVKNVLETRMGPRGTKIANKIGRKLTHSGSSGNLYWGYCVDHNAWSDSGCNNGNGVGGGGNYNQYFSSLSVGCGSWTPDYRCMNCNIKSVPGGTGYKWNCNNPHNCLSCRDGNHFTKRCPAKDS